MAIIATIAIPNLVKLLPQAERKAFISNVTSLTRLAWQQALITQKAHRVLFDLEKHTIIVEQEKEVKDNKPVFEPIKITYGSTRYQLPENIKIKQFFINKEDVLARRDIKTEQVWFYLVPDGLAQAVTLNAVDATQQDVQDNPVPFSLQLNPFSGQFTVYDEFKKP